METKEEPRLILGLIELVTLENGRKYKAKIDSGADSSSIDISVLDKLGEKKTLSHKIIISALGRHRRPTKMIEIELQGKKFKEKFTVSDRSNLKYKILIGQDILKKEGFLIDPCKEEE